MWLMGPGQSLPAPPQMRLSSPADKPGCLLCLGAMRNSAIVLSSSLGHSLLNTLNVPYSPLVASGKLSDATLANTSYLAQ